MKSQEVVIKPILKIVLESDNQQLDEVMVVAYGTTKKASFTGSASVVKSEDLSAQKESFVKSLQGKVAGIRVGGSTGDPGADQRIQIRGISSISASSQPLYVIDGVAIVNNDVTSGLKSQSVLSSINPDDIENLTVLKDAAAASLYGSRAANGVIIITTKQGKQGKQNYLQYGNRLDQYGSKKSIQPDECSRIKRILLGRHQELCNIQRRHERSRR